NCRSRLRSNWRSSFSRNEAFNISCCARGWRPMSVEASCPACGAPIAFKMGSSIVVVCEFCHSVVARGDRKLEDLGKVAALVETNSPLEVGLRGAYQNISFELTGRA